MKRRLFTIFVAVLFALTVFSGCAGSVTPPSGSSTQGELSVVEWDASGAVGYSLTLTVPSVYFSGNAKEWGTIFAMRTRDLMIGTHAAGDVTFDGSGIYRLSDSEGQREFAAQYTTNADGDLALVAQIVLPSRRAYLDYLDTTLHFGFESVFKSFNESHYLENVNGLYIDKGYFGVPYPIQGWFGTLESAYDGAGALGDLFSNGVTEGLSEVFDRARYDQWVDNLYVSYYLSSYTFSHGDGLTQKTNTGNRLLSWSLPYASNGVPLAEQGIAMFIHVQRTWAWVLIVAGVLVAFAGAGFLFMRLTKKNSPPQPTTPPPSQQGAPVDPFGSDYEPPEPPPQRSERENPFGSDYES